MSKLEEFDEDYDFNAWKADAQSTSTTLQTLNTTETAARNTRINTNNQQLNTTKTTNANTRKASENTAHQTFQQDNNVATTNFTIANFGAATTFVTAIKNIETTYKNAIDLADATYLTAESNAWSNYAKKVNRLDEAYGSAIDQLNSNPNFDAAGYVTQVVTAQSNGGTGNEVQPYKVTIPPWLGGGGGSGETFEQAKKTRRMGDADLQNLSGSKVYPYQKDAEQGVMMLAEKLPVASQIIDTNTIISDETTTGDKAWAGISLALDFMGLLASTADHVSDYAKTFKTADNAIPTVKNVEHLTDVVPTNQVAKATRELGTSVASKVGIAKGVIQSKEEIDILKAGGRIEIPAKFENIRLYLSNATRETGEEVLLFRATDGKRYVVMGKHNKDGLASVIPPKDATRLIAHTHPSGDISKLSPGDKEALKDHNQRLHVLISPWINTAKMFFGYEGAPTRKH